MSRSFAMKNLLNFASGGNIGFIVNQDSHESVKMHEEEYTVILQCCFKKVHHPTRYQNVNI